MAQIDSRSFAFLCPVAAAREYTEVPVDCHDAAVYEALEQRGLQSAIQYLVAPSSEQARRRPRFVVGSRSISRSCVVAEQGTSDASATTLPCCRVSVSVSASPLPSVCGAPCALVRVSVASMWLKLLPLHLELSAHLSRRLAARGVAEADDDSDAFGDPSCVMFPELEHARISAVFSAPPGFDARGMPHAVLPANATDAVSAAAHARFVGSFDALSRPAVDHRGEDPLPWVALGAVLDAEDDSHPADDDAAGIDVTSRASMRARGIRPISSVCRSFQLREGADAPPAERNRCAHFTASVGDHLANEGLPVWFPCEHHDILSPDSLTSAALTGFVNARMLPQSSLEPPLNTAVVTTLRDANTTSHQPADAAKRPTAQVTKKKPRAAGKARAAKAR